MPRVYFFLFIVVWLPNIVFWTGCEGVSSIISLHLCFFCFYHHDPRNINVSCFRNKRFYCVIFVDCLYSSTWTLFAISGWCFSFCCSLEGVFNIKPRLQLCVYYGLVFKLVWFIGFLLFLPAFYLNFIWRDF